ncbi:hypothetical protein [Nocardia wallacei]|uniref:hypothetical protein n=1 Tax=Nocardia wallacei TaxID=480035 RepID=UPI002458418F|nr:hypothetical protein [Nocardia wallacei]
MSAPSYNAHDALKYLVRRAKSTIEWSTDSAAWQLAFERPSGVDLEPELEALHGFLDEVDKVLGPIALAWSNYSDGRPVMTRVEIEHGSVYEHLWHPDPAVDKPHLLTGRRIADPGTDNGSWRIFITPPSSLTVELLPPAPVLRSVPTQ